jgi:nitrite reductase/ring-hydroxylating ferredoxin subunit
MADSPQARFEEDLAVDPRVDSAAREGLTGTAGTDARSVCDPEAITQAPDHRPMEEQPRWRTDFPIDWPQDHYVARRDFAKFLVLISFAFVFGQGWIAAQSLLRKRTPRPARTKVASLRNLPRGAASTFRFPTEHDPCLLIRTPEGEVLAYSQTCTHLSCAVVPRVEDGVLHCPCHEGYFDLRTGRNIAGPPPRPLPRIRLEVDGDDVFATAVEPRPV